MAKIAVSAPNAFQSARPARGATSGHYSSSTRVVVSIRTPREGRDILSRYLPLWYSRFQSARPARGATLGGPLRRRQLPEQQRVRVSIRTPREGRDADESLRRQLSRSWFQSARPARGATFRYCFMIRAFITVSIRTPREGRDLCTATSSP